MAKVHGAGSHYRSMMAKIQLLITIFTPRSSALCQQTNLPYVESALTTHKGRYRDMQFFIRRITGLRIPFSGRERDGLTL